MLTEKEALFVAYWRENRLHEQKSRKPIFVGLSIGLGLGILLFALMLSGWYERALMVANARLNGFVFIIAITGISFFISWIYKKFSWENKEQYYRELLAKQKSVSEP